MSRLLDAPGSAGARAAAFVVLMSTPDSRRDTFSLSGYFDDYEVRRLRVAPVMRWPGRPGEKTVRWTMLFVGEWRHEPAVDARL